MTEKKLRKFDTKVQHMKYKVLREVARRAFSGNLAETIIDIPKLLIPGPKPTMCCCIHKERAIVQERVKMAVGGNKDNPNVIEVLELACDECPASGYAVTNACRGCMAHRCEDVCPRGAITFDEKQRAHIDKTKCINCGQCSRVCPYSAITKLVRPCEQACKMGAISAKGENMAAHIDDDKCVSCGACVYQCPFGAIVDKSYILDAIRFLRASVNGAGPNVYAVVAPAIASQFTYATLGQVFSGLHELGFYKVIEAALGADLVADEESRELVERRYLSSSCCPAFVDVVQKRFPELADHISSALSPMATMAKIIKERHPEAKVVFIGPCTAKKRVAQMEPVKNYVDCVITFEELQALFDSRDIDISTLPEREVDQASGFGRRFAKCGGLAEAVAQGLKEHDDLDFVYKPVSCNGLEECIKVLTKASKSVPIGNFIEGMACVGGCVGGAGCLTHADKNRVAVEKHGDAASIQNITESVVTYETEGDQLL
ncbi:MAG: 4Fe-4S dicluster domain-containing protein [Ruminococcaceae bacterium]|nr:4Fe-4S dicluster domain-containing protein [Oscillospiraceae bacterium]